MGTARYFTDDPAPTAEELGLVYDPKTRKRPPGAGDVTIEVWKILAAHSDGMTLDEIHEAMRHGWAYTDAYRAYDRERNEKNRRRSKGTHPQCSSGRLEYGTPAFKTAAQRRAIYKSLAHLRKTKNPAVRRDGDRWYATDRAPEVQQVCDIKGSHLAPLSLEKIRAEESVNRDHVRREHVKAALLGVLNDPKAPNRKLRAAVQEAFNYLSGR